MDTKIRKFAGAVLIVVLLAASGVTQTRTVLGQSPTVSVSENQESSLLPQMESMAVGSSLEVVNTKVLESGDSLIHGFIYHNGYLWASTRTSPARILKVDPSSLNYQRIVLSSGLDDGEDIEAAEGYIWVILYTDPGRLIRINPETLEWQVAITFGTDELTYGGSLDYAFGHLWVGGRDRKIARINLGDMTYQVYGYPAVTSDSQFHALTSGGGYVWASAPHYSGGQGWYADTIVRVDPTNPASYVSVYIDAPMADDIVYAGGNLYTGSETSPSYVYRIVDTLAYTDTPASDTGSFGIFKDQGNPDSIWGAYIGLPGEIVELDLGLNIKATYTLPAGFNHANEIAFDTSGNMYVTCWESPAKIVKLQGIASSYSISGRVIDATSNLVISGVTISDSAGHSTTTREDGNYTLSGLSAGLYTLSASKNGYPGYYRFWPTGYSINLTADVTGQDFFRILDVPVLWQDDPNSNWAGDIYNLYPGNTIAGWGCATTSAAMVLNYYGAPYGGQTDPKELDDWLATNSGYVPIEHEIIWGKVGVFADKKKGLTMGVKEPAFIVPNEANLDSALADGIPPIVNVCCTEGGWHWVVVTGAVEVRGVHTYSINDPLLYGGHETLDQYSNQRKMLRYESGPSVKPLPGVWLYLCSPANMLVTDSLGRRSGIDTTGQEVSEIPGASYADEYLSPADVSDGPLMHTKTLVLPEGGTYNVEVTGTGEGSYALLTLSSGSNGELLSQSVTRSVHAGQNDTFVLSYSSIDGGSLELTPAVQRIYMPIIMKNQ